MASKKNEYKHKLVMKKDPTKNKKLQKRRKIVDEMNEDRPAAVYHEIDGENSRNEEKSPNISNEYKEKILNIVNVNWLDSKKETDKDFLKNLTEITSDLESDHSILKSNLKNLEEAATQSINELQQATSAVQNIITTLTEIEHTFKKESNAVETKYQSQIEQIKEDYDQEIKMLKEKLVSSTKKHGFETLQRSLIQAMQINKY